jgi:hypothetical protein
MHPIHDNQRPQGASTNPKGKLTKTLEHQHKILKHCRLHVKLQRKGSKHQ